MPPPETDLLEKKSYGKLFFILGGLFFVVSAWAFFDEFVSRRSWKQYQHEFNLLEWTRVKGEYQQAKEALEAEDRRRDQIPEGVLTDEEHSLRRIRLSREEAEIRMGGRDYRQIQRQVAEGSIRLSDAAQRYGFAKADQDEVYYEWKHALEKGDPAAASHKEEYYQLEGRLALLKVEKEAAEKALNEAKALARSYEDELKRWMDAEKKYLEPLHQLEKRMKSIRSRGLEIHQVIVEDLGKGGAVIWGTVDRCQSCHVAINREGFENEKNPFKTHPHRMEIFGSHPIENYGCTTCHGGQGRATQIKGEPLEEGDYVHGVVPHWEEPLLRGDDLQSSCVKCHLDQWKLDYAPAMMAGKKLFWDVGCTGCHAVTGFEEAPKVGPSLRKLARKTNPEWLVAWIKDPSAYLPHTRMPTPPLDLPEEKLTEEERRERGGETGQIEKIASYLWQRSEDHRWPFGPYPGGDPAEGRQVFETVGCLGCHRLGDSGTGLAPALDRIAEKTDGDWIYNWLRDPKKFSDSRMPNLRLTAQEASDVTAFLLLQGKRLPEEPGLRQRLKDPSDAERGFLFISRYGCYGCHDIEGFEKTSKLSVELTSFGKKDLVELDFGDTTTPRTWEAWTRGKIKNPRRYLSEKTSSKMPDFRLSDEGIHALVLFLKGLKKVEVPQRYIMSEVRPRQKEIEEGRRMVERLNCKGCHLMEGEGRLIEAFLPDPGKAPPILDGIGARVRPEWMFEFLKDPASRPVRRWLEIRMPTFQFRDSEANRLISYFSAVTGVRSDFYSPAPAPEMDPKTRTAVLQLVSPQYFSCFSCHVRGGVTPATPPSQWGPDLALARQRIRPEFIPEWIKDPQRFTPGVIMPAFLPDDSAAPPDILGGDRQRQAEAIRDWMLGLER